MCVTYENKHQKRPLFDPQQAHISTQSPINLKLTIHLPFSQYAGRAVATFLYKYTTLK